MLDGLCLQIFCLLYMIFLSVVYYKKKRIQNSETKIYSLLIIFNIIGTILHILSIFVIKYMQEFDVIGIIIKRSYLVYLLTYAALFTSYVLAITFDNKSNIKKIFKLILLGVYIICFILVLCTELNTFYDGIKMYTYGLSVDLLYVQGITYSFIWIISLLSNLRNIRNKKYIPLIIMIIGGVVVMYIQKSYPYLLLMTALETFITVIMYFTIENPDVKMLEEYHKAKELAEKSNNEKAMFLLDVAESIRRPATDIKNMVSEALDSNNKDDYLRMIRTNTESILTSVNETLDVNAIESHDLKIVNTKYNAKTLFRQLTLSVKEKLEDKDIDLQVSIDDTLPDYLYGDSIRLKEIMSELLDNSVKYTKKGFIALTLKYLIRNDVCRLLITLEDSGSGIESDRLNEVFNQDGDSKTKLGKIKSLVNLIGGTIVVNSEYGTGTKFTIVLDQKLVEDNRNDKLAQFEDKYMNTKKILLFDYNEKDYKDLKKYLRNYDIDVDYVTESVDGLNKIRNKEKYNLILIKEDMPKLDGDAIVFKLKEIPNYKTPYVMLIENAKNTKYREYLVTPLKKDLLLEIIDKYIKK